MKTDFDIYQLSEEYDALREAVRAVAENKVAPHAAEADRMMRDAKITQTYEGPNQIQRLVMARHVLGA